MSIWFLQKAYNPYQLIKMYFLSFLFCVSTVLCDKNAQNRLRENVYLRRPLASFCRRMEFFLKIACKLSPPPHTWPICMHNVQHLDCSVFIVHAWKLVHLQLRGVGWSCKSSFSNRRHDYYSWNGKLAFPFSWICRKFRENPPKFRFSKMLCEDLYNFSYLLQNQKHR
jgi:hypothetical protein